MGDEPYTELKTQLEIERLLTVRVLSASVAIFDTANYPLCLHPHPSLSKGQMTNYLAEGGDGGES